MNEVENLEKRPICSCKFPILVRDLRDGSKAIIDFYGIPLDVISEVGIEPPKMEIVTKIFDGVSRQYMKVTWLQPHNSVKEYEVLGHIMVAGCEEGTDSCDIKSIYVVYHPIEEWYAKHVIEIK